MRRPNCWFILSVMLANAAFAGTVTMDGSLPGSVSLSGSTYTISAGRQAGANQFYSFQQLNLVKNDIASFTTPMSVSNIIARVTGGQSSIDGSLSAPNASFFLINNQGVIFGPDASLNIGGAFVVTTADELKFADGKVFTATPSGSDATLSTAAPSAFGFLSSSPQAISVNGSTLSVSSQQPMTVIGGNFTMIGGTLQSSGGRITVVSAASSGTITVDPARTDSPVALSGVANQGTVSLSGAATLSTSGNQGGPIVLRAGQLSVISSSISTATTGTGSAGNLDAVITGAVTVDGSATPGQFTGMTTETDSSSVGGGNAGDLTLSCASLQINYAKVEADTFGTGAAGNVTVSVVGSATIDGNGDQFIGPNSQWPGISANCGASANTTATGPAGTVTLSAASLSILNAGNIEAQTWGTGPGGTLNINVSGSVTLDGSASPKLLTQMIVSTHNDSNNANAGNLNLNCGSLNILGAYINASSFGSGTSNSGNLVVNVSGNAAVNGNGHRNNQFGIVAAAYGGGNAGTVSLFADELSVENGGLISASATAPSSGLGGTVEINSPGQILLNAGLISAETKGSQNAGSIAISAIQLDVDDGSLISTRTYGSGTGGNLGIVINGPVSIDGTGNPGTPSEITAGTFGTGTFGNAGNLNLSCSSLSIDEGYIDASSGALTNGNAGNVTVAVSGTAVINGGGVSNEELGIVSVAYNANSTSNSGSVIFSADELSIENGAEISTRTFAHGNAGNVTVMVSGQLSIDGFGTNNPLTGICDESFTSEQNPGLITVSAGTLTITDAGEISAQTLGPGSGSDLNVSVTGSTVLDGTAAPQQSTGLVVTSAAGGGNAGNLLFTTGTLDMTTAVISAATEGSGSGGNIAVEVRSGTFLMNDRAKVLAASTNTGSAGDVTIGCQFLTLAQSSEISSASQDGQAGSVIIHCFDNFILSEGSSLDVFAFGHAQSGGNIDVTGHNIYVTQSSILASAEGTGGNIFLNASGLIQVANSIIDAQAGGNGSQIEIDPQFVIIGPDSVVNGLSAGRPVVVQIGPTGGFFLSDDSQILTKDQQFDVNNDIVANLGLLGTSLADINIQLAPTCSMFATGNSSTFIQSSNGGLPPQPGGWNPSPMPGDSFQGAPVR